MNKIKKTLIAKTLGLVVVPALILAGCIPNTVQDKAKTFTNENGTKIIRTYEMFQLDHIFIENLREKGTYVQMSEYFNIKEIKGHDRKIERAKINKLIDW